MFTCRDMFTISSRRQWWRSHGLVLGWPFMNLDLVPVSSGNTFTCPLTLRTMQGNCEPFQCPSKGDGQNHQQRKPSLYPNVLDHFIFLVLMAIHP
jgi:hypothetical protein